MISNKKTLWGIFSCFLLMLFACTDCFGYGLTGYKWNNSALPVPYYINQDGSDDISDNSELTAVQTSFQTWTNVGTASVNVTYQGTTALVGGPNDGYNVVCWANTSGSSAYTIVSGAIAVCQTWYNPTTGDSIDSDIIFNGVDYTWSSTGESLKMDVQNIATHEIGHFFGLDDLYGAEDVDKTMYGYGTNGETKKRDLAQDDIDGISALYPYDGVANFSVTPVAVGDASWIVINWKNPTKATFQKTMLRYKTDGTYPATTSDGTLLVEKSGTPGSTDFYSHTGVAGGVTYHYTAFTYDSASGYSVANVTNQKNTTAIGIGGTVGGGGGGCFIATICFGNDNAKEVLALKKFRDNFLSSNMFGRKIVNNYYLYSPYLTKLIEDKEELKSSLKFLLEPAVIFAEYLNGGK